MMGKFHYDNTFVFHCLTVLLQLTFCWKKGSSPRTSKKWMQNNDITTADSSTDVKKPDHSYAADGNVKWTNNSGKQFDRSLKN